MDRTSHYSRLCLGKIFHSKEHDVVAIIETDNGFAIISEECTTMALLGTQASYWGFGCTTFEVNCTLAVDTHLHLYVDDIYFSKMKEWMTYKRDLTN